MQTATGRVRDLGQELHLSAMNSVPACVLVLRTGAETAGKGLGASLCCTFGYPPCKEMPTTASRGLKDLTASPPSCAGRFRAGARHPATGSAPAQTGAASPLQQDAPGVVPLVVPLRARDEGLRVLDALQVHQALEHAVEAPPELPQVLPLPCPRWLPNSEQSRKVPELRSSSANVSGSASGGGRGGGSGGVKLQASESRVRNVLVF